MLDFEKKPEDDRETSRLRRRYERKLEELGILLSEMPEPLRSELYDHLYEWAANQKH